jgi:hypothetical protein
MDLSALLCSPGSETQYGDRAEENRPNRTANRFYATSTENTSSGVQKLIFFIEDLNKITFDTEVTTLPSFNY